MNEKPKEGIYLDAALAVIGEQVDERIDQLARRRVRRTRALIASLAVATVASGSVAAVALTSLAENDPVTAAESRSVAAEVRCVDGPPGDTLAAYFTARYRTPETVEVDSVAVCEAARVAVEDDETLLDAAPSQLVTAARELIMGAAEAPTAGEASRGAAPTVRVDAASFGPLSTSGAVDTIVCDEGLTSVVVSVPENAVASGVCSAVGE